MKIKEIEFKNISSYGNKKQKISFDKNEGNFYLMIGANGSGKSTTSDAIKFALYGKLKNKKISEIPNRFNKSAWCRIVIEKDNFTTVTIERGISPSFLKCFVNGQEYDQAGKKNVQNFIEEEIIGLPFYVFNNVISLSINDFKSFLNMKKWDKRMIIDKIFSLEVLNRVRELIKEESKSIHEKVLGFSKEIEVLDHAIEKSNDELKKLEKELELGNEKKIEEYQKNIQVLSKQQKNRNDKLNDIIQKENVIKNKISEIKKIINNENYTIKKVNEKELLYKNDCCPTCGSDLSTDEHKEILNEWIIKKEDAEKIIEKNKETLQKIDNNSIKIAEIKKKVNKQVSSINFKIDHYNKEIKKLSINKNNTAQTKSLKNIINESTNKKNASVKNKNISERKGNFYRILDEIFSETGVKRLAIKKIVPTLNKEINILIKQLNLEYRVLFDEEFDANIEHLGHEISPSTLSTGERKKLDFAILIAIIKMMKIKFQGLNLIFLDEIFSSLDSDAIHHVLEILSDVCKEYKMNIFVINHSPLPVEIFDYKISVEKNDGFSDMTIEKIQ